MTYYIERLVIDHIWSIVSVHEHKAAALDDLAERRRLFPNAVFRLIAR